MRPWAGVVRRDEAAPAWASMGRIWADFLSVSLIRRDFAKLVPSPVSAYIAMGCRSNPGFRSQFLAEWRA